MITLEERLDNTFIDLNISCKNRESVKNYLFLLKCKTEPTYEHSVRVALLGTKITKHLNLNPKPLFYAGLLHDVGKTLISPETLKKTGSFSKQEMEEMEKHVEYGAQLLRGVHDFSSEILLRHHKFQESGYPKILPKSNIPYSEETKLIIDNLAKILAIADFYDAITSRDNGKFGEKKKLTQDEIIRIMMDKIPCQKHIIKNLHTNNIFC